MPPPPPEAADLPWLDYTGQPTYEILAASRTHRIDSILCALEQGLLLRQSRNGKRGTTPEERLFLSVMALDREVNNGGYSQFFCNSSRQYVPIIVAALNQINCSKTAALTQKAIDTLGFPPGHRITPADARRVALPPNSKRDRKLDSLDNRFYRLNEIDAKLFAFTEANAHRFRLEPVDDVPPPPKLLHFGPPLLDLSADTTERNVANSTVTEMFSAAYLMLFERSLRSDDLPACQSCAESALDLCWKESKHCELHFQWVEKLIAAAQYLRRLATDDAPSSEFIRNRITYWANKIGPHAAILPESAQLLRTLTTATPSAG